MSTTQTMLESVSTIKPPSGTSWKSLFASRLAAKKITEEFEYFKNAKHINPPDLPKANKKIGKVCIVGAGMSGLYIAMILDRLNIPGLSYEILEADKRFGGRIYTHRFSDAVHDYYDVGAMRFPEIPIMDKTFALFRYLKMPLIKYYLDGEATPNRFNDITVIKPHKVESVAPEKKDRWEDNRDEKDYQDPFRVSTAYGGRIMPELVDDHARYVTEALEPFKMRLRKNWSKGFEALMKYDNFSVRGFMMSHGLTPLDDYFSIQWLETMTDGSGLYDQGFSEGVIDSLDFDYYTEYLRPDKEVKWKCIDGGTSLLTEGMRSTLKPTQTDGQMLGKRVTSIALQRDPPKEENKTPATSGVQVKWRDEGGETKSQDYAAIFNTTTLACLQRIDLSGLELLYEQKDAIRSLHYDTASKVGMKFKYPWWIKYGINKGGLGKTDMPLRTCVYPSYNLDPEVDPRDKESILLVSYCWSQDAARLGSLMKGDPKDEVELRDMLFNNLAWLHLENAKQHDKEMTFDKLYDEIANTYITHHAFDWHNNPYTSGAYGKFGPGQFQNLYTALSCPTADDRFFFVGEAASAHHGWIVGALDSAHMAVIKFLCSFGLLEEYWPMIGDPNSGEYFDFLGPLPDECTKATVEKQVRLGQLLPEQRMAARVEVEKEKAGADVKVGA